MARTGRRTQAAADREKKRQRIITSAALALVAVALGAFAIQSLGGDGTDPGARLHPVDGLSHLHGIAVNPSDPGEIYLATHFGLHRVDADGENLARIGPSTNDLMGFTVHPANGSIVWASGHPNPPQRGYPHLGVVHSLDGGMTWETLALGGEVDFHAMTVSRADPDVIWGFFNGKVWRSDDGGRAWRTLETGPPAGIASLTTPPGDANAAYAATPEGLFVTRDAGETWKQAAPEISGALVLALAVDPDDARILYAAVDGRGLLKSTDAGSAWTALPLDTGADKPYYVTVDPSDPASVYVGTLESRVHKSTDGGETWARLV